MQLDNIEILQDMFRGNQRQVIGGIKLSNRTFRFI